MAPPVIRSVWILLPLRLILTLQTTVCIYSKSQLNHCEYLLAKTNNPTGNIKSYLHCGNLNLYYKGYLSFQDPYRH